MQRIFYYAVSRRYRIFIMCINPNDNKNCHKNNIIARLTKALAIYITTLSRLHREKISVHQFNFVEIKKPCRKYRLFHIIYCTLSFYCIRQYIIILSFITIIIYSWCICSPTKTFSLLFCHIVIKHNNKINKNDDFSFYSNI